MYYKLSLKLFVIINKRAGWQMIETYQYMELPLVYVTSIPCVYMRRLHAKKVNVNGGGSCEERG